MRSSIAVRAFVAAGALALCPAVAQAAAPHTNTVVPNAVEWTPQLVPTTAVAKPRVDAVAASPAASTAYAGGLFGRVSQAGSTYDRTNLVAFDRTTGAVDTGFNPTLDGVVRTVENAGGGGVYVGGDFKNVNGVPRAGLVKLTASGAIDTTFKPPFKGIVYDLEMSDGHLVVAGNAGKRLSSLNPTTGAYTSYINHTIAGEAWNTNGTVDSWGVTSVYDVAVKNGRLAAVGNFATVDGAPRSRFFMLNLGATSSLSTWYYDSFKTPCATDAERRIASLQGVDFSPDGQFVSVAATGQIPELASQIWHEGQGDQSDSTVCDGFGRFSVTDDSKAEWINYTGGDSVWRVQDTGFATYVTGHFKWVDNPNGFASQCPTADLDTCDRRSGLAAVSSTTGRALDWNPAVPTTQGGKALEATSQGLWVGSDSSKFGAETHRGLAFAPARR